MKKLCFFSFLMLTGILGVLCVSCNGYNDDSDWRDANIDYMSKISKKEGILRIGDPQNGYPGIYYEVITTGDTTIKPPIIGDVVTVDYSGWLYNETDAFDSGTDFSQQLGNNLISGWSLILERMHVGDTWKVYIPYYLGYGITSYNEVPAYSTLIFTIKLKKITTTRDLDES